MASEPVRVQISREVKRVLSERRMSARAAAKLMPKRTTEDPKLLYRWINEEVTAPLENLEAFAVAVGQPITLVLGKEKSGLPSEDDRPLMKSDLVQIIDALARTGALDATAQGLLDAALAALVPQPHVAPTPEKPKN